MLNLRPGGLWINPISSWRNIIFLNYWLGCLGLGGRTSSFSISSFSFTFSCSYLTGVEWRCTAPYCATCLYLIFSGSPLISSLLTPELCRARKKSSMPTWCKSYWLLTIDLKSDLKLLPRIAYPYTTAFPFLFLVKISGCSVIFFKSLSFLFIYTWYIPANYPCYLRWQRSRLYWLVFFIQYIFSIAFLFIPQAPFSVLYPVQLKPLTTFVGPQALAQERA